MDKYTKIKYLQDMRHNLVSMSGLVATDKPDLHNLDTDAHKDTVWAIDTDNEVAMIDEILDELRHYHGAGTMVGKDIDECAFCGHDIRNDIHSSRKISAFNGIAELKK